MTRLLRTLCLVLALGFLASCSHIPLIGKRTAPTAPKPPKEDKHLATAVEQEFKQRWIERRVGELVGQGVAPDTAHTQAAEEFRLKYSVTNAAHD